MSEERSDFAALLISIVRAVVHCAIGYTFLRSNFSSKTRSPAFPFAAMPANNIS